MGYFTFLRKTVVFGIIALLLGFVFISHNRIADKDLKEEKHDSESGMFIAEKLSGSNEQKIITGPQSYNGNIGFPETVEQIMERDRLLPPQDNTINENDLEERLNYPDRRNLQQNPDAKEESSYPPLTNGQKHHQQNTSDNPQTVSTSFTGITVSESGFIPADNMGAVGPTQYVTIANGRIKTFTKSSGAADGVINTSTDNFFNSVRNSSGTSDPRVRYDRMSQRWFVVIINVSAPNRILIAVSNSSTITGGTVWTFYFISSPATVFYDYPTLGIDNNAVYIGTNNFNLAGTAYLGTSGYVINKAGLLVGSATATLFSLVPTGASSGPYTPQGVDNFDASATEGYFIGVDNLLFSTLVVIRVSNPGTSPTISGNLNVTVNTTTFPRTVLALGSTRPLDALDDRLFAATIRNGRLWTAHNIQVNTLGVASGTGGRNGSRWYELTSLTGTPTVVQSGTIFDPAASNPLFYWIPTVMISGQGHAAFIFSSSGAANRVNVSTAGRLSGDVLGTTQSITNITATGSNYNVQTTGTQRWGDYSYVSLDPVDDMTMWGVMGFCDATDSWGERVTKLLAPPPPALTSAVPPSLTPGQPSVNVVITGVPTTGQGFYDPGSGFTNRISATINGGVTVNSTTYNSSTQVTLNVSTVGATTGAKTVTITNPDGQFVSSSVIFDVPLPVLLSSFTYSLDKRDVTLNWSTSEEVNNKGFDIERQLISIKGEAGEWAKIGFVQGHGNSNNQNYYEYVDLKLITGKYNYRLKQTDFNGNYERFNLPSSVLIGIPVVSELLQNYPNPFNPLTKIDYGLSIEGKVSIVIYDIVGREVAKLVDEIRPAGYYTAEFNASSFSSGVYFYKISAPDFSSVRKMLVIK